MSLARKFCRKAALVSLALACKNDLEPEKSQTVKQKPCRHEPVAGTAVHKATVRIKKHVQHLQAALRCAVAYTDMCCTAQGKDRNTTKKHLDDQSKFPVSCLQSCYLQSNATKLHTSSKTTSILPYCAASVAAQLRQCPLADFLNELDELLATHLWHILAQSCAKCCHTN